MQDLNNQARNPFTDFTSSIDEAIRLGLGTRSRSGALMVQTGKHTGRSVKERFVVRRPESESKINWGSINQAIPFDFSREFFAKLDQKLSSLKTYEISRFVGGRSIKVRSTSPWHIAFASNMFRAKPIEALLHDLGPEKTIHIDHWPDGSLSSLGLKAPTETLLILDPTERRVGIVGTAYAGEIKKSAFTLCNFEMPDYGIFPMHASANCLQDGSQSSVLFGLSGTGKTTLSADPNRFLIGDDEIVWSSRGLSNLEGGCYAKLIDLKESQEPEIYRACHQKNAILENVVTKAQTGEIDFSDRSLTENTRGSYPLSSLAKVFDQNKEAEAPRSIIFLTADAFGALPVVARLNTDQAKYHFVSGYTAKVAGTEMGVKEPQAAFSTCFGAPFMPRHPSIYAQMLTEKAQKSGASIWLLNTGWGEGGYGRSDRYPIRVSRAILSAIQSGEIANVKTQTHPVFGFEVPEACPGIEQKYLNIPTGAAVKDLAKRFVENINKYGAIPGGPNL